MSIKVHKRGRPTLPNDTGSADILFRARPAHQIHSMRPEKAVVNDRRAPLDSCGHLRTSPDPKKGFFFIRIPMRERIIVASLRLVKPHNALLRLVTPCCT